MITELTNSAVGLAVQGLSAEKHKITINTGAATSDLTGKACEPYGFHWAYDTHALAAGTGGYMTKQGGDTWFFLTADYAFGTSLQSRHDRRRRGGGRQGAGRGAPSGEQLGLLVLPAAGASLESQGRSASPMPGSTRRTPSSRRPNSASSQGGQKLAGLLYTTAEVHGLGLKAAQGSVTTEGYYWDLDDKSREFGNRYLEAHRPHAQHDPCRHLFGGAAISEGRPGGRLGRCRRRSPKKLHEMPVDDFFAKGGKVLANGRMVHDMYLFQIKTPEESKGEWDLYKLLATVPGSEAYFTLDEERLQADQLRRVSGARQPQAAPLSGPEASPSSTAWSAHGECDRNPGADQAVQGIRRRLECRSARAEGSIHGLIGPNGAGKTTCFNLLDQIPRAERRAHLPSRRGHHRPQAGRDRAARRRALLPDLGRLPASHACATICVRPCNARTASRISSGCPTRRLRVLDERAAELIADVNLTEFSDTPAGELAYGRKRALEIATTLALEPEVLLLDEPMAGIGREDLPRIIDLVRQVAKGRTVVMVEHNLSVVANLCDRVTVLAARRDPRRGNLCRGFGR